MNRSLQRISEVYSELEERLKSSAKKKADQEKMRRDNQEKMRRRDNQEKMRRRDNQEEEEEKEETDQTLENVEIALMHTNYYRRCTRQYGA